MGYNQLFQKMFFCNSRTPEVEAGKSRVQGQPCMYSEFETSLGFLKPGVSKHTTTKKAPFGLTEYKNMRKDFFFLLVFQESTLCNSLCIPGTHYVYQAVLEHTEIQLPLPLQCWN